MKDLFFEPVKGGKNLTSNRGESFFNTSGLPSPPATPSALNCTGEKKAIKVSCRLIMQGKLLPG